MASSTTTSPAPEAVAPRPYLADLYTFDWTKLCLHNSTVSTVAPAVCLIGGVLIGHPSAGLIAGGGAVTIGFGINQRIADSRLAPMLAATLWMFVATFIGMWGGHHGATLLVTSAIFAFAYGILTAQASGVAWVGQQAAIALFVSSAFPAGPRAAFERASLTLLGGAIQIVIITLWDRLLPELRAQLKLDRHEMVAYLRTLPKALPELPRSASFVYAVRLTLTVLIASEAYRRWGVQSGYWIPMTALLVQKPAFFETLTRALLRVAGTLTGAVLCSHLLVYIHPNPIWLAILATGFAFLGYATVSVNYGLYSLFLTSYIVFLLSLNSLPAAVVAHRRAVCTLAGGLIALALHLDGLRRHRAQQSAT
ncbi:Fusaric acid resistance protein-like [Granulicella rosea]|uniref:Fusaric acid resistance protein-like n=1 Tax=Granulicella rosea TaxID=474952 RepID=A0A239KWF2_9BACT|nr:FUSC family protein [Granulicella rosea]SNT21968.1 Fusaric acid resistance protein-like [Granulicella rosea]